ICIISLKQNITWHRALLIYVFTYTVNINLNIPFILIQYYKFATWKELQEISRKLKTAETSKFNEFTVNFTEFRQLALVNQQLNLLLSLLLLMSLFPYLIEILMAFSSMLVNFRNFSS